MSILRKPRRKAVWGSKRTPAGVLLAVLAFAPCAMAAGGHAGQGSSLRAGAANFNAQRGVLDHELAQRGRISGSSKVIITLKPGMKLPPELRALATQDHGALNIINGHVITIPNRLLARLAAHPAVLQVDLDRPLVTQNFRTAITTGSAAVQRAYGFTGAGVGVAIIDSGITDWHDDLTNRTATLYPYGNQRVSAFVDFVTGNPHPHDDNGHGTHVAGIIAGNGFDSNGQKAGVAPDASLIALKVLDANGAGTISNIIAAFDWVVVHHADYNIRVVNASVGALITESYTTDPLTQAAKRVVDAGVAVVVAAGNRGKNSAGQIQYGGVTSPGNAPWVITVGASSTNGTPDRADDTIASFSSRGPTYKDYLAKPDLVAPGAGTISLASPGSTFYGDKPLVAGSVPTANMPYLTLSGTSMAAPVVAGTIALMMQADPALTPNMAKAILEYTAQPYPGYNGLTQGAGFLNTLGAVRLAQFFATARPGDRVPADDMWSKKLLWGNHMLSGGTILPAANAFRIGTLWGAAKAPVSGENIVWGTADGDDNIVWGTSDGDDNIVWGTADGDDNIVWGTDCGGDDCDNIVWGTSDSDDNIVWGTSDGDDNIVWGTSDGDDNIVWGTDDADGNIVWGTVSNGVIAWQGASGTVRPLDWNTLRRMSDEQVFSLFRTIMTNAPAAGSL